MAIPKRLTSARKVVSRFDPAWASIVSNNETKKAFGEYCNTLDIEKIGDPLKCDPVFTVFEVIPLQVESEPYVNGDDSNWWEIFKTHVKGATGMNLEFVGGEVDPKHRKELGPVFVKDIADMIVQLSNVDGVSAFFIMPAGWWDFIQTCQRHHASEVAKSVRSAGAKASD